MSHKRNEALRHVQHSMHHVIAAGEGSDRAPDSCKLCPYYRPDFKFRTCLYAHCPYKKQVNVFRSTPEKWDIHNYFFAKAIDQVRPGGIIAFVTSRYTMDSKDSTARKHMAEHADLLGAIRLPNNAFRANAGTDVVSDIIFLQKRDRPIDHEPDWVQLGKTEDGFAINQYFADHPEMILGVLSTESTQYGREE